MWANKQHEANYNTWQSGSLIYNIRAEGQDDTLMTVTLF